MSQAAFIASKIRERSKGHTRGQTMTEYALIMAAIGVVVFLVYQTMGTDISNVTGTINGFLSAS